MTKLLLVALLALLPILAAAALAQSAYYDEPWRPQFHFTPAKNFMNDPNGLVYYEGEYHLFYQYNPQGNVWGHMSWGHAVSADMLHWRHLPVAIPEEEGNYMIFSGSAVVDWRNKSGLCEAKNGEDGSCLAAIYTAAGKDVQRQNLAYSNDRGRTWKNYSSNPVADLERPDFRDPKVFWYEPEKKWVMVAVLADERKVQIFDSRNLREWKWRSAFGPAGDTAGQWECPDLFELPVEGKKEKKWVLIANRNPGAPAGGTGTKYFVGSFDGAEFKSESPSRQELWADYGKDFYATNTFADLPDSDGRKIWLGWISNWQYANVEPTVLWRGAQSIPRVLKLRQYRDELRMVQEPVREMLGLRGEEFHLANLSIAEGNKELADRGIRGTAYEIEMEVAAAGAGEIGLRIRKGAKEMTILGISSAKREAFMDRTNSGEVGFSKKFAGRHSANLHEARRVKLHVFVDRSSVELFVNDGEVVMTERIYPLLGSDGIELYSDNGQGELRSFHFWQLQSVWKQSGR
jgi:fructan beta-fructosidase